MHEKFQPLPRTVRPRLRKPTHHEIVSISRGKALDETCQVLSEESVRDSLADSGPMAFVSRNSADLVASWDKHYSSDPNWQWKVSHREQDILSPAGFKAVGRVTTIVHYFGWRGGGRGRGSRYHLALDPVTFSGRRLDDVWPGDAPDIYRLLWWGVAIRDWCERVGVSLRPTQGSISSQFLTNPKFYPGARRKVPRAINTRARENLPGNHYQLFCSEDTTEEHQAIYLDQRRAHHYHARTTALPSSNHLFAYGHFLTLENIVSDVPWREFAGLYCLQLSCPEGIQTYSPLPPAAKGTTSVKAFCFSNELSLLADLGYKIEGVVAAWGSMHLDTGLRAYAEWSEQQLDSYGDAAWLKPILLATYGILAAKPREMTFLFHTASRGDRITVRTGHNQLHGVLVKATQGRTLEPGFANVLHRAMIEAGTRADSLGMAHYLESSGHTVLSIYADAVIVADDPDKDLPLLPEPWRRKETLTHLQFINQQAFVSSEMSKLPGVGVGRELLKVSRGRHGVAPHKPYIEALSGRLFYHDPERGLPLKRI